jgi:hypothetical protein
MKTFKEQQDFFSKHWPEMKVQLETGDSEAGAKFIKEKFDDDLEKRVMYVFARGGIIFDKWKGKNLDACIPVAEAGIEELIRQAEKSPDEETRNRRIDTANVISYNLGADLAFCWDDPFKRNEAHFRRGLKAGEECLRWRQELSKPPMPFSLAYWLCGIHRLALNDKKGALKDFKESLSYAELDSKEQNKSIKLEEADGTLVFAHGWIALVKLLMDKKNAQIEYDNIMELFRKQTESKDEHISEDAKFYVMQLEKVKNIINR